MTRPSKPWSRPAVWGATIVAALLVGFFTASSRSPRPGGTDHADHAADTGSAEATIWTCAMHPQIQLPEPGPCPICGMDLIPLVTSGHDDDTGPRSLTLSPGARAIAEVQTAQVHRMPVSKRLRLLGTLETAEPRTREITAWVAGRIEKLFVDFEGATVRRGDRLYELYSPDVYAAQEALLQAMRVESRTGGAGGSHSAVEAARERLRLWGLTDTQVRAIEERGTPEERITIVAPVGGTVTHRAVSEGSTVKEGQHLVAIADLSLLWLQLDAYQSDLPWIRNGQDVSFETTAWPGEMFEGTVEFVDPTLSMKTRTTRVRVAVKNESGRLKPGFFARATIRSPWLQDGENEDPITIPATAPLITGRRAVVYVAEEDGKYTGREVVLGPRAGDMQVVKSGLRVGERVVTNGAFKIDSALQIQAKTSMMSSDAGDSFQVDAPFRKAAGSVLQRYLEVSKALSLDEIESAKNAAGFLARELHAIDSSALDKDTREKWEALFHDLATAAHATEEASDLEEARAAFYPLSNAMIAIAQKFSPDTSVDISVFHCPMANHNEGADWLQTGTETENPYFGQSMLRCGSATSVALTAGDSPDER